MLHLIYLLYKTILEIMSSDQETLKKKKKKVLSEETRVEGIVFYR
jgi:hypothetical protein